MHAWRVNELGHPSASLRFEDVAVPQPGAEQVRIRVEAGNINFADILLCQGIYQDRPGLPFTPGLETCGVVEAAGPGVGLAPGRIAGMAALPAGGYAEQALVRAPTALLIPDDVPAADATVLYSTYQTAHVGLHHRAGWPRVSGCSSTASSGVGAAAVRLGAAGGRIATAAAPKKAAHCIALGAEEVIDHRTADVYAEVMRMTGGNGVDVAYDPVGGALGELTRRLMADDGRFLVIGFASGEIPSYPANHILVKNYTVLGLHWGAYVQHGGRAVIEAAHADLVRLYREGAIGSDVTDTVDLAGIPRALAALEAREVTGRLVLVP